MVGATLHCSVPQLVALQLVQNYSSQHALSTCISQGMMGVVVLEQMECHMLQYTMHWDCCVNWLLTQELYVMMGSVGSHTPPRVL